jgi:peptidyl-prolyl cis-trans isomerase A (cyclophilin A)
MAIDGNQHPPINVPGKGQLMARFITSMGVMEAVLYEHEAPSTVANFVGLALGTKAYVDPRTQQPGKGPYYDGTQFHRVIPEFMIQGGDPTATGRGGPGFTFKDELNPKLRHDGPGVLSMANAGPNTNGSQFFICEVATPHLNNRHAVFGKVVNGVPLIAKITHVPTGPGDKPVTPVVLERVEIYRGA